ncbi:MAG: hypothetical protein AMXMBFR64_25780 [Myxococcales bacterium]
MAATVRAEGGLVLTGSCAPGDTAPYAGLRGAIEEALSELDRQGRGRTLAPLVAAFALDPGSAWGSSVADLIQTEARANLFEAVRATLQAAADGHPTVVVVRDAHRMDADSLDLLEHLCASVTAGIARLPVGPEHARRAPTFVVECLLRPDAPDSERRAVERLTSIAALDTIRLEGMGREDVAAWLASDAVVDRVMALTGGVPHRLRLLLESLPDDLDDVARACLQALAPEAQHALRVVGVADGLLTAADVAAICDETEISIARALLALRDRDLVVRDPAGRLSLSPGAPRWESDVGAADLHRVVAERLAARWTLERDDALVLEAARHFAAAGDRTRAFAWGLQAGALLQKRLSHHAARQMYRSLLDLHPEPGTERTLRLRLAESAAAVGRVDEARAELEQVIEAGAEDEHCALLLRLGELYLATGQLDRAASAIARASRSSTDAQAQRALALGAEVARLRGELRQAEELCAEALATCAADARADLLVTLGNVRLQQGRLADARRCYGDAVRSTGSDLVRARAQLNLGIIAIREGAYSEAIRQLQRSHSGCEEAGEFFGAALSLFNLGVASEFTERYGLAEGYYVRAVDLFDRLGRQLHVASALSSLADVYITMGAPRRAARLLQRALALAGDVGAPRVASLARQKQGLVELELCRFTRAVPILTEAAECLRSGGATEDLAWTLASLSRALLEADRPDDAMERVDELRALQLAADHEVFGTAALVEARVRLRGAEADDAAALAREADGIFARRGQRAGRVEALCVLGEAHRAEGDTAAELEALDEARTLLDALKDAVPLARRQRFLQRPCWRSLHVPEPAGSSAELPEGPISLGGGDIPLASSHVPGLVGASEAIRSALRAIDRVAASGSPVLLLGESGTGKELVARAIHDLSSRAARAYVRVNSAALPESLLESELFGHERGAFTGAVARREGKFEQADGGTLFLDEIGDVSQKTQVSLLRVLQEGEVQPVGASRTRRVDVRVICATNRDLAQMVREERFRLDLYFRIRGVTIELPPLRERRGDVGVLARHFIAGLQKPGASLALTPDSMRLLEAYRWPGNVRELESVLRGATFFAEGGVIRAEHLRRFIERDGVTVTGMQPESPTPLAPLAPDDESLDAAFSLDEARRRMEIKYIALALERSGGNITKAAELLKMTRPRLSQKIKDYDISSRTARDGRTR